MAVESLQIEIKANVDKAVSSLKQVEKQTIATGKAASAVGSQSMPALAKGTGNANMALVNFGRVIQDAPFGLIGIANNIDPLLSSFQQLQKETGSSKAAFQALTASLAGPAGLAIAVSAVTSLLIAFGPQIQKAINSVSEFDQINRNAFGEAAKSAKEAQLEFEKYSNIINDGTASSERQKDALNKINSELADYGLKIKSVADFQKQSATISQLFIKLKQEEARAQFLAAQAAELYAKQIKEAFTGAKSSAGGAINILNPLDFFRAFNIKKANDQIKEAGNLQNIFETQVKESEQQIANLINQIKNIPGIVEDFGKKTKDNVKNTNDLFDAFKSVEAGILASNLALQEQQRLAKENADLLYRLNILGGQDKTRSKIGTTADLSALRDQRGDKSPSQQLESLAGEFVKVNEQAKLVSDTINNGINQGIDTFFNALANNQDPFKALIQSVQRLVVELGAAVVKSLILKTIANSIAPGSGLAIGGLQGLSSTGLVRGDILALALTRGG